MDKDSDPFFADKTDNGLKFCKMATKGSDLLTDTSTGSKMVSPNGHCLLNKVTFGEILMNYVWY